MNRVALVSSLLASQREGRAILQARESTVKRRAQKAIPAQANMSYNAETGLSSLAPTGSGGSDLKERIVNSSKLNPNI